MAEFQQAVLTQKGIDLLAKAQSEKALITFTRAVAGSGLYEEDEDISYCEELKSFQQSFAISTISRKNNSNVIIRFAITNLVGDEALEHGYRVTEVGIMAEDPDEGEILYGIAIAKDGESDYLPAYNDLLPAVISVDFLIEVSNAERVVIQTELSAYATKEDIDSKGDSIEYDEDTDELALKSGGKAISTTTIGLPAIRAAIAALQAIISNLLLRIEQVEIPLGNMFTVSHDAVSEQINLNQSDISYDDETIDLPEDIATYYPRTSEHDKRNEQITVFGDNASYDPDNESIEISDGIALVDGETVKLEDGETIELISEEMNTGGSYTLPTATSDTIGGVKIGAGLVVLPDGTIAVA